MGFDFIVIAPLLPSHCGFSFVFGCGVSFLVSSSVFLLMIVQQLAVIPVLSQKGVQLCFYSFLWPLKKNYPKDIRAQLQYAYKLFHPVFPGRASYILI